jgi:hypothetical protein
MVLLLIGVAIPFLASIFTDTDDLPLAGACSPVRLIRRISEDEVIAEFLRTDFGSPIFRDYRETMKELVDTPSLEDPAENAKRRALLFMRHLALWKEIPHGTEWYEVEVNERDLESIRVFPRAQWRRLARGNYAITQVAGRMKTHRHRVDTPFLAKIDSIREQITNGDIPRGVIIMIGLSENDPLTVVDGNHRLMAAMLASPSKLPNLRFVCGLSPQMRQCCWYNTNLETLFRYGKNMLVRMMRNPESELTRLLQEPELL